MNNNLFENVKEKLKYISASARYSNKCKKFNISKSFLDSLIDNTKIQDAKDILNIIEKSSDAEQFKNNIINYLKGNPQNFWCSELLAGMFIGKYNHHYTLVSHPNVNPQNILNFKCQDKEKILKILKEHFYEYITSNNSLKNRLHETDQYGVSDLSSELNHDNIDKIFEAVISGSELPNEDRLAAYVLNFIYTILNNYTIDDIINNYGFIKYDLLSKGNETIDERREKYNKNKNLGEDTLIKIDNIEVLKEKLRKINNERAKELLERINGIDDLYRSSDEIEDIYLEYESLFREDIIDHLFVPNEKITIIEDFRDTRPQLIHRFIRNPDKFKDTLKEKIIDRIIADRNNGNKNRELSQEEQLRFNKLLNRLEAEINQTTVNYSFDSSVGVYSDSSGFIMYKSDTRNQIATTLYSDTYFYEHRTEMIGIGFNSEGLTPEGIVLSSPTYLTTNKGLNNIEYNQEKEFETMSASYSDLVNSDGTSEVVLFRNNIDFDTKAAYIFVAFDSERNKNYMSLINKGKQLAEKNNLKLVLYDLAKIRESYKKYQEESAVVKK